MVTIAFYTTHKKIGKIPARTPVVQISEFNSSGKTTKSLTYSQAREYLKSQIHSQESIIEYNKKHGMPHKINDKNLVNLKRDLKKIK